MRAMVFEECGAPLRLVERPDPVPGPDQVLIAVKACGVCRTDLHLVDGDLTEPKRPVVPGHEIVGIVLAVGERVDRFSPGDRVGVPWLGWTCGVCVYCLNGRENLCDRARFTGYHLDGGYADRALADHRYCFALPLSMDDVHVAPLLCAGLIGYRALRMAGEARNLGLYGFGAAGHLVAQVARTRGQSVFVFCLRR